MSRRDAQPGLPPIDELNDPSPFSEPWQAQAFALVVALHERAVFSWDEWAASLSTELKQPGVSDDGSDYYECWLRALETLLIRKGIAGRGDVEAFAAAWSRAARATPHGEPIILENDPQRETT
ncbi:MAG: nitrile hydratase accessory protein [Pseudomonadota bacterium]